MTIWRCHADAPADQVRVPFARYPLGVRFERIAVDSAIMDGVPCIRGTRIPVVTVVRLFAEGLDSATVLRDYPQLTEADLQEALRFAAAILDRDPRTLPAIA